MTREDFLDLGHRNLAAFYRESALWGRTGAVHEEGGVLCYASATRFPAILNGVMRTDNGTPPEDVLDRADEFFGLRGRGYSVWARSGIDDDLAEAAEARDFAEMRQTPEMVVRERLPDRLLPAEAALRPVASVAEVAAFAELNGEAYAVYGMQPKAVTDSFSAPARFLAPHVHGVIAWIGDEAAAAALTLLSHGIAGVYWVGTRERFRGHGLGEAVTRAATNIAFDLGARANTLQSSQMGDPIYRRMGFEEVYRYRVFVKVRAAHGG